MPCSLIVLVCGLFMASLFATIFILFALAKSADADRRDEEMIERQKSRKSSGTFFM